MAKQVNLDKAYMKCAFTMSKLSSAVRKQVGAIIVKEGIIAEGYNGTPSGFDNCCESKTWVLNGKEPIEMIYEDNQLKTAEGFTLKISDTIESVLTTLPEVLHAESNAIAKVARSNNSSVGSTMYVTLSPCVECAKLIIQAGITRVVYAEDYRATDGPDLLKKAGITVEKIDVQG